MPLPDNFSLRLAAVRMVAFLLPIPLTTAYVLPYFTNNPEQASAEWALFLGAVTITGITALAQADGRHPAPMDKAVRFMSLLFGLLTIAVVMAAALIDNQDAVAALIAGGVAGASSTLLCAVAFWTT
jgi:hypothetical protein